MGNSASNANNPAAPRPNRTTSISPGPGNPHRSMKSRKRSLELPDLASLSLTPATASTRGRQKTQSIPIPSSPQSAFKHYQLANDVHPQRAPVLLPSTTDVLVLPPPSTHQPFPPRGWSAAQQQPQQQIPSAPRGRQQPISARQQQQVIKIQEMYDRSQQQQPAAPPSSPAGPSSIQQGRPTPPGFVPEVVHSSSPVLLGKSKGLEGELAIASPMKEELLADPVPVKIVWKGGGSSVVLARAGDDDWKGRQFMIRE